MRQDSTMRNFIVLYLSPNIVRVIKSRKLRLAGNVARMEESRSGFKILSPSLVVSISDY